MSRQLALEKELQQVKSLNKTVDTLLETISNAQTNIADTKSATDSAGALLEDWIKILNQTAFVKNALQDSRWKGQHEDQVEGVDETAAQTADLEAELKALEDQNKKLQSQIDSYKRPDSSDRSSKRPKY
ncbi:uncharacterized protein CXQ87_003961 [Candidozyma duobushaemuli]|uniref:DASH complex subunit DUO1 n=2 Tax=Candidozyma TaxID=3303203 RepID=A0ABX8ICS9_9ASCO|nr:uncharacterized protein CXQ87_003961 [[Candida] duobushaemulonis]PVH16097.1 hypothetical protein CXQ87_003961 [[Candida] duobushaemulonis]QWU89218.1 hypothetical protein CA3LBN_003541 [[Candida] haemuloni]